MCLRKLAIVNDTLKTLGAPKEYQRLRNWIIRIIIGLIIWVFYDLAYAATFMLFYFNYISTILTILIIFCRRTLIIFLINYPIYVIILTSLISKAIFGLVLYMYTHLFCKLFLLTLCVKIFTV